MMMILIWTMIWIIISYISWKILKRILIGSDVEEKKDFIRNTETVSDGIDKFKKVHGDKDKTGNINNFLHSKEKESGV